MKPHALLIAIACLKYVKYGLIKNSNHNKLDASHW